MIRFKSNDIIEAILKTASTQTWVLFYKTEGGKRVLFQEPGR